MTSCSDFYKITIKKQNTKKSSKLCPILVLLSENISHGLEFRFVILAFSSRMMRVRNDWTNLTSCLCQQLHQPGAWCLIHMALSNSMISYYGKHKTKDFKTFTTRYDKLLESSRSVINQARDVFTYPIYGKHMF